MKALTLWQPWASLVAAGLKTIETRPWSTNYRGPLAIHAAKRPMTGEAELRLWWDNAEELVRHEDLATWDTLPLGKIVATVNLVRVVPTEHVCWHRTPERYDGERADVDGGHGWGSVGPAWREIFVMDEDPEPTVFVHEGERPYGDYTPGRFAWLLDDVKVETPPIEVRGGQRLWNWDEQR